MEELVWLLIPKLNMRPGRVLILVGGARSYLESAGVAHDFIATVSEVQAVEYRLRQTMPMTLREMLRNTIAQRRTAGKSSGSTLLFCPPSCFRKWTKLARLMASSRHTERLPKAKRTRWILLRICDKANLSRSDRYFRPG